VRGVWDFVACVLLALTAVAAMLAAAGPAGATAGAWRGAGMVQAPGGPYLTDALGRRLQLHGVNLVAKCGGGARATAAVGTPCVGSARGPQPAFVLSPTAKDPGRRFTAADARTLSRLGFNVVRLGIIWEGLEPGPAGVGADDPRYCAPHRAGHRFPSLGKADPYDPRVAHAYLNKTDKIVRLLSEAGIRVVLDMHQDAWGSVFAGPTGPTPWNGEGAPPWATCTNRTPFTPPVTWPSAYFAPAVKTAIHHFWANDVRADLQAQFARAWTAVARHYRGNPDVVGYEIYNEPADFAAPQHFDRELQCDYGGPVHEPRSCAESGAHALRNGLIGAIQSADRRHVVFFEPGVLTDYGLPETIGITEPLRFRGVALAFHLYGPPAKLLARVTSERARTRTNQPGGPPWIMDEFGADNNTTNTSDIVARADRAGLSWAYWAGFQLHDPTGNPFEALIDQQTRKPDRAKAPGLAVPYPLATAGRPGAQSFDSATGTFTFSYAPTPSTSAVTEIELPRDAFPHGYRVHVRGAEVVSTPGAAVLELSARARARRVRVNVTRH
jgi:endoglycosylceramidase